MAQKSFASSIVVLASPPLLHFLIALLTQQENKNAEFFAKDGWLQSRPPRAQCRGTSGCQGYSDIDLRQR